jgi:hypothetical protein
MSIVAPLQIVGGLPLHVGMFGWTVGLLHTAYVLVCSAALIEFLSIGFRKIPFTCTRTSSKDKVLILIVFSILGLSVFAHTNAMAEARAFDRPLGPFVMFTLPLALIFVSRVLDRRRPPWQRTLIFEDRPAPQLQVLNLSKIHRE